jgi:hypothetical protein
MHQYGILGILQVVFLGTMVKLLTAMPWKTNALFFIPIQVTK